MALFLKKPRIAGIIAIAISGGMFLTSFAKRGFDRPRPDLVPHGVVVTNASFPSGHAMMSAIVYLTLGVLLARTQASRPMRIYLIALSVLATILVGICRIYLGVHWPKDMAGAMAMSAAMALLVQAPALRAACAHLLPVLENLYRRVLALPIGRGWLRP